MPNFFQVSYTYLFSGHWQQINMAEFERVYQNKLKIAGTKFIKTDARFFCVTRVEKTVKELVTLSRHDAYLDGWFNIPLPHSIPHPFPPGALLEPFWLLLRHNVFMFNSFLQFSAACNEAQGLTNGNVLCIHHRYQSLESLTRWSIKLSVCAFTVFKRF
jgi:hypothetical protein